MTRIPIATLALAGALLMLPVAAASHWRYDYQGIWDRFGSAPCHWSHTDCVVRHYCPDDAPPQVVDRALYCGARVANGADDLAAWVPEAAWDQLDWGTNLAEDLPSVVNAATARERDEVNGILCNQVWSFFCVNPIALPGHVPVTDPVGPYPLP